MPTTQARIREAWEEYRIVRRVSSDPDADDRVNGSVWYRTDLDELRAQEAGAVVTVDTTAV
ncbi:hypothetical protein [Haloarcula sp. CBA1127]|uniref:hypothetical protein n=1 Tax=Haloarcula sp. CBA1127 TaxID=1765055 RepID=UPI00073E3A40|nr:hypothetical protein [Haloarcula sp. CBA1127]